MKKSLVYIMFMLLFALVSCGTQEFPVENIETPVVQNSVSETKATPVEEKNTTGYDYAYTYTDMNEMEKYVLDNNLPDNWRDLDRVGAPFQFENTKVFRFSDTSSMTLNGDFGNLGLSPSGDKIAFDKFDKNNGEDSNLYIYDIALDTKNLQNISKDFRSSLDWLDDTTYVIDTYSDITQIVDGNTGNVTTYSGSLSFFDNGKYFQRNIAEYGKIAYYSQDGTLLSNFDLNTIGSCNPGGKYESIGSQTIIYHCSENDKIFSYDVERKLINFEISLSQDSFSSLSSEYSFMDYRVTNDSLIIRFDKINEIGVGKGESVFFVYNTKNKTFGEPLYEKDFTTTVRIVK